MTTTKLSKLFEFQRFEGNARLQKVIDETHHRIEEQELTEEDLDQIAAAGVTQFNCAVRNREKKQHDGN